MTAAEYLDAKRFPLSSQPGLTLKQQKMMDAINHDSLKEMLDRGEPLSEKQQAVLLEFQEKAQFKPKDPLE